MSPEVETEEAYPSHSCNLCHSLCGLSVVIYLSGFKQRNNQTAPAIFKIVKVEDRCNEKGDISFFLKEE
ncbi:hypothetical protein Glove_212g77 [Diversispora epigaea]|uniref:Uncharacterized protein n=1 Tax=Diversispora epigaea TaxID=1348612 RepID=A0A397IR40_9GLOM|nr:hypothetical protein Glove_212g77 [Diversispora epigaea]